MTTQQTPWTYSESGTIYTQDLNNEIASVYNRKDAMANAKLIAAAPELFSVLCEIVTQNEMGLNNVNDGLIKLAKQAIAKAE